MESWTYERLFAQADFVAIASPQPSKDTKEEGKLPNGPLWDVVGVETVFDINVVLKGDKDLKKCVLHHYRLKNPNEPIYNGPSFALFGGKKWQSYLLFLTRESDGRYAPVSGQTDPATFSILRIDATIPPTRLDTGVDK